MNQGKFVFVQNVEFLPQRVFDRIVDQVIRSNLAKAYEVRNSEIFEGFAYHMIAIARKARHNDDFEIKGKVDSTTIDLCLSVMMWVKYSRIGCYFHFCS